MPSIDFGAAPQWLQALLIGTAVLGAVVGIIQFVRKGWPVPSQFVTTINARAGLPKFIDESNTFRDETRRTLSAQNRNLDTIKHELFPNSGKSMRDEVNRQGVDLKRLAEKLASDNTRITDLEQTKPIPRKRAVKPPTKKETP